MKVYTKRFTQTIPISVKEAWDYFSNPRNLSKITPAEMDFNILSPYIKEKIYPGQLIYYSVKPLLGIKMTWLTEITEVKEGEYFIDLQLAGPYKLWHHEHRFNEVEGGVEMEDIINYSVPFGFLGRIMNSLVISKKLEGIFSFRKTVLERTFVK